MSRHVFAFALSMLLCGAPLASDEQVVHDCDYWLLGKDDVEKASRLGACDRIIKDKHFAPKDRAMAYAARANFAAREGRKDDAIADLDEALALAPDSNTLIGWRRTRADLLHFKGLHERAIEDYDKVLAAQPDANVMFFRGLSYLSMGDEKRGFADLGKGIELAPDDHWYRYQRGLEYAKRGQADAAIADLDKAIALKSDDRSSYLLRAELLTKKGDIEKAIVDLTRAIEIDPEFAVHLYPNRALLYEQTGQYDRALTDYDKLLSLKPGDQYYTTRRYKVLAKAATHPGLPEPPAPKAPAPAPEGEKTPLPPPVKVTAPLPAPPPTEKKASKPVTAGKGECRRYDAIANMTIAVACPD